MIFSAFPYEQSHCFMWPASEIYSFRAIWSSNIFFILKLFSSPGVDLHIVSLSILNHFTNLQLLPSIFEQSLHICHPTVHTCSLTRLFDCSWNLFIDQSSAATFWIFIWFPIVIFEALILCSKIFSSSLWEFPITRSSYQEHLLFLHLIMNFVWFLVISEANFYVTMPISTYFLVWINLHLISLVWNRTPTLIPKFLIFQTKILTFYLMILLFIHNERLLKLTDLLNWSNSP